MRLIKWDATNIFEPFRDLLDLQLGRNRLFDSADWVPSVDIYENKDNLVIKADLPGLKQSEVDVSIEDGVLRIKGEKKNEKEVKEKNYYRLERVYGSFERSFALPTNVDANKIKATFKDGVLELNLPKKEESKPKQIKVDIN